MAAPLTRGEVEPMAEDGVSGLMEDPDPGCPIDVVVPTRDRPAKLSRCLAALREARSELKPVVHVVDSSTTPEMREAVRAVCDEYPFVRLHRHERQGYAAARNECSRVGSTEVIVSVDDDVYVTPTAIDRLWARYQQETGWRVVAGSVSWGTAWSGPIVLRYIGYGKAGEEQNADFYVTALILYPRQLVLQCPFNEKIASSEDRFAGALWRSKGVKLLWAKDARAHHDEEHSVGLSAAFHQSEHIYTNLFDSVLVRRSFRFALAFEVLGFAAGVRRYRRSATDLRIFAKAWGLGHLAFLKDWRMLSRMASKSLIDGPHEQ